MDLSQLERRTHNHIRYGTLGLFAALKAPTVHCLLLRHPRVHFPFTPTYASWLKPGGSLLWVAAPRR